MQTIYRGTQIILHSMQIIYARVTEVKFFSPSYIFSLIERVAMGTI